jgi:hypothetical protein
MGLGDDVHNVSSNGLLQVERGGCTAYLARLSLDISASMLDMAKELEGSGGWATTLRSRLASVAWGDGVGLVPASKPSQK